MELEVIILSEGSQKEKDKYHMISLICGIYDTSERICKTDKKKITCDSKHDPMGLASTDWSHSQITLSPPDFWCWRRGSCSQVDSPVPQTVTLPLVVEAENGNPLPCKSCPFTSGALGALLQRAPGGSPGYASLRLLRGIYFLTRRGVSPEKGENNRGLLNILLPRT